MCDKPEEVEEDEQGHEIAGPSGMQKLAAVPAQDVNAGDEDADEDSDEWEDQDSEDEKLMIDQPDEPPAKKIKRSKKESGDDKKTADDAKFPESILRECKKFICLDKRLDKKAKKNNMTSKQVKLILKHIFSSPQLLAMLRDQGLLDNTTKETKVVEAAEPKMTRQMARTLTQAGEECPWIINPKTPMKEPAPEIMSLVLGDLPEQEEADDPEYTPDLETRHSEDEDSYMMSETSEAGTPRTNASLSTINTPVSDRGTPRDPQDLKRPLGGTPKGFAHSSPRRQLVSRHLQFETQDNWEGYGTRSRRPLTSMAIEDIEQQFIPFDITPDMYDIPCPNDDYADFLKTLYAGSNSKPVESNWVEEEEDPEYSFPPDEEDLRLKDPEELRDDRATKISRKELADLMAELLDCANEANQDVKEVEKKKKRNKKKRSAPLLTSSSAAPSPAPSVTPTPSASATPTSEVVEVKAEVEEEAPVSFTPEQINLLTAQVQQHVQQVTQMRLLASHNDSFSEVLRQCDMILRELHSKAASQPSSVLAANNLDQCLDAVNEWENTGQDPVIIQTRRKDNEASKKYFYTLKPEFLDFVCDRQIISYPSLLPSKGLIRENKGRLIWTNSEDTLLAQALERTYNQDWKRGGRHKSGLLEKVNMKSLAVTINAKHMPAKTVDQIFFRLKNLRRSEEFQADNPNPIVHFLKTGSAPTVEALPLDPCGNSVTLRTRVGMGHRDDIPTLYIDRILRPMRELLNTMPRKIEKKEVVVVEPDWPNMDSSSDESGSSSSDEQETRTVQEPDSTVDQTAAGPAVHKMSTAGRTVQKKGLTGGVQLRPRRRVVAKNKKITTTQRLTTTIVRESTAAAYTPLRSGILCVDGNETPVSLSESDTPTNKISPSSVDQPPATDHARLPGHATTPPPPPRADLPTTPPNTDRPPEGATSDSENETASQLNQSPDSTKFTRHQSPGHSGHPSRSPAKPVFRSPIKTGRTAAGSPSVKSPFKSPLKSISSPFARSPLKAASDRIVRKYGSPLKRRRRVGGVANRSPITPKRLIPATATEEMTPPSSARSPLTSPRGTDGEPDTPTAVRRKTRIQKEHEITLALLGELETTEEKEARETREAEDLYAAIQAVADNNKDIQEKYEELIGNAGELGVKETYLSLNQLMEGHPEVQEMLLDLLSKEEAAELGSAVFKAYSARARLKRFLLKLGIVYKQQPAYHAKVLKELETLSKDPSLTSENLKNSASRLLKSNQHLLDEFLMLIPGIPPPHSMLPSPEMLVLPGEEDEDNPDPWAGVEVETVAVPKSPLCDDTIPPTIRFTDGRCYVYDGKYLKPAKVEKVPLTSL